MSTTEERADAVFADVRERLDRGEPVDADDVIRAHPDLAPRLARKFAALRMAERAFADDAADAGAPAARLVGRTLGAWRLASVLGSGGMGTVFLAESGATRAAVKVIHAHLLARHGFFERFLREAEIGRRVRHENVVATLDAGTADVDGRAVRFLVMEHVEGRTLRALLAELGRVPEELCRHVGREAAKALAAIHAAGAVHRDLKPDNVLITKDDVVKVMDLGVARLAEEAARLSQTGAFVGSVRYGAPEQFAKNADIDGRADLYALGLTLYELATGRHPFEGDDFRTVVRQQMTETPRPAGEVNPQLSPFFEEVLRHLLEKHRDARFESAAALLGVLEQGESSTWWQDRARSIRTDTRRPLRRIRIPRETALYGRDAELAKLRELFDAAKAGDGRVVLVEGEAGIGKSRLVDEFVGRLAQAGEDVNFVYGSYPPGGAATASGAFTSAYREHLGDDDSAVRAALPQTPLLVPAFAALLRGDVAPAGVEPLTRDSLQTAFVHATRSFAATRPTIVLIDDLHFAPEEGRALFASLALAVPGHRVLLVGTARPEVDARWIAQVERIEHVSRVRLPRLGAKDLVLLLRDSLRSEHLAEELGAKIAVKSDGNPFFVFEILRGLRDGQFLTRKPDGTWGTTKAIAEIEVPDSVRDLIFARVGSLSTVERNLLDVAACAGFEFDPVLVGEVLRVGRIPVLQRLAAVEKSHRLVRSSGRRFAFDHHQIAEVLYAALPEMLREEYHAAIGAAMEAKSDAASIVPMDRDGALCVALAEHFLKGAHGPRALRYLDAALTHLEKGYLNDAAVRLADRALAVPGLVAGRERFELLVRKAARLDLLGRAAAERAALDESLALADAEGDPSLRAKARVALGWHLFRTSAQADAQAVLAEALSLARAAGDRELEAAATGDLGNVFQVLGRNAEALEHLERRLALAREAGDRRSEASATGNLGVVFHALGRNAEALEHHERHLALARETGDRRGETKATGNLGIVLDSLSRFAEAREHHERNLAQARETGDRRSEAMASGNLANVLWSLGRHAEARERHQRHLALARETGDRRGEARALVNLGLLHLDLGRRAAAREVLLASLAICREVNSPQTEGYALRGLGTVADEEGDAEDALRLLEESLGVRRTIGHTEGVVESLIELGDLRRRANDAAGARACLDEASALARESGSTLQAALAAAVLANLPGGDAPAAGAALAAASEGVDTFRAHFLLWQATRDPAHLAEAKRLLDFLVAYAPADCRESMLANVRLHREIAAAAREQGLPLAADSSHGGDDRPAGSGDA